jgi:dTDP-glucose pyrophosphorylase
MDKAKLKALLVKGAMTIKQAMQRLNETAEKIIFVVDEGDRLLGTITDGDVRRGIIKGLKVTDSIESIVNRNPTTVNRTLVDREDRIKEIMVSRKLDQIPVLDGEGRIVDVVFWLDIIKEKVDLQPAASRPNRVVIMAGGKGTRLDPFTKILPKPLIPIGNRPIIEIIMERFFRFGFHRFTYTLNYKREYLKLFLKENRFPYSIDWVEEDDFMGTAGGLSLLARKMKQTFFVSNCDCLLDVDFEKVLDWHKEQNAAITVIGCHSEVKIPFGVLDISDGRLESISEKPVHDIIINTGVYVMEPHVFSYIPRKTRLDMNELIATVMEKEKVSVYPIYDGWLDIGQWEEYKETVKHLGMDG